MELDRGDVLRLGAGGLVAAAATGLAVPTAGSQLPPPTRKDDDVAFLSFATVAESTSRDFYRAAFKQAGTGLSSALNGVAFAEDPATRLFLGRLLGPPPPRSTHSSRPPTSRTDRRNGSLR